VPELPEVETIVRDLRPRLVGRVVGKPRVSRRPLRKRWVAAWGAQIHGRRIEAVQRRGKWIILVLDGDRFLVIHLGMTGQLTVTAAENEMADHTHLIFELDDGREQLRFRDIRRFGSATFYADRAALEAFFGESGLGPEPFGLDAEYWRDRLAATRRNLKAVLLDQRVVAGVGNIYADEALYEAKLHPALIADKLNGAQADRLREAVVTVLTRAIEKRGSSIRNYVGGSGLKGEYQREFRVYGQFEQPCQRCHKPIARSRLAGRSTHYCPSCQKKGREKA
jgi:formamidopyrimidine-DNA glycosylase